MLPANRVHDLLRSLHGVPWNALLSEFPARTQVTSSSRAPRYVRDDSGVAIEFDLPGRKVEDFSVTAKGELLSVACSEIAVSGDAGVSRARERDLSGVNATLRLPFVVQGDLTEVLYQNGVLRIVVKAPQVEQPVRIPVVGV
ncbi:Hsp20/alpha crystallin family protein [Planctomicrobium sp. SH527]|uniref:Hsp20/alpha crystallin family protein n=1 Tax=Planctomicrobium sp. SH527 TaxID=3448123 RepID=UPI003F5B6585